MTSQISDRLYSLCRNQTSVSSMLAEDPKLSPGEAASKIFGSNGIKLSAASPPKERTPATPEMLQRAFECGNWGPTRPSNLFLKMYHDALLTLEPDLMTGCVSPSLMGSHGVMPLSIIAPLPDIARHMSNVIARAEHEVFFATNYWMNSDASALITDAFLELSKRAGQRGKKAVVKVMYDRGDPKQILDNHQKVPEKTYTVKPILIPGPDKIPNIDMQVVNYHRPVFGTFHSKFAVIDRKIGIIASCNIQDNDNMEMMTHIEGPIVDSLYDTSLISWHNALEPPLPSYATPAAQGGLPTFDAAKQEYVGGSAEPNYEVAKSDNRTLPEIVSHGNQEHLPEHIGGDPHFDPDIPSEVRRMQSVLSPLDGETRMQAVTRHLNEATHQHRQGNAPEVGPNDEMTLYIPHPVHQPFPMALVNRKPWGAPNHECVYTPQNEAWLSGVRNAERDVFIQTPDLNAEPLLPELVAAVKRGIQVVYYVCLGYNDTGELLPRQGGTNEMAANSMYEKLDAEERKRLHVHYYVGKDQVQPISNKFKSRSCHIKLMIVDGHIGIQGNGNQDTQSWYHSQEVNVMIDSEQICHAWIEGIRRNQNTHIYGKGSQEDGIWRDEHGNQVEGAIGKDPGKFPWAKGVVGAIQRVRGVGGF